MKFLTQHFDTQIQRVINLICLVNKKVNNIMLTLEEQRIQLEAIASDQAIASAKLDEAMIELSGFPQKVMDLQKAIDDLIASSQPNPAQQAAFEQALANVSAKSTELLAKADNIANIVPNPVV